MKKNELITIGEMSKICEVHSKTLKYYEKIKLLIPAFINSESKYRYYSYTQVLEMGIIKKFKIRGFSLHEIKEILNSENINSISNYYLKRNKDIEKEMKHLKLIYEEFSKRLGILKSIQNKINDENFNNNSIKIKKIENLPIISIRDKENYNTKNLALRWSKLQNLVIKHHLDFTDNYVSIFYNEYNKLETKEIDFEVGIILKKFPKNKYSFVHKIVEGNYATILYKGDYQGSLKSYKKIIKWINQNNYQMSGPIIKMAVTPIFQIKNINLNTSQLMIKISDKK